MLVDTNPNPEVPHVRSRKVKPSNTNQSFQSQPQEAAQDKKTLRKLTYQLIEAEERGHLIRDLLANGVGFREEEEFLRKERAKLKGGKTFDDRKLTVKLAMGEKQKDNYKLIDKLRRQKSKLTKKLVGILGQDSIVWRTLLASIKRGGYVIRGHARKKFRKKKRFLVTKYGQKSGMMMNELSKEDQSKYGGSWIFDEKWKWDPIEAMEPCVIRGEDKSMMINEDERNLLKLGPKFCVLSNLCDEEFEVELEQSLMKVRWDMMSEEDKNKRKTLSDVAIDNILDEDEKMECEEFSNLVEARTRMIYDVEGKK